MNQKDIDEGKKKVGIEVEEGKIPSFDQVLKSSGVTVRSLAAKISCAESSIHRWKSREGPINSDDLIAIAKTFGMTTDDVLASLGYDMSGIPTNRTETRITKQIYLINDLSHQSSQPTNGSPTKRRKQRETLPEAKNKPSKRPQKKIN